MTRGGIASAAITASNWRTPLYLHYNTGRHNFENGRDFAKLIEELIRQWPTDVT
jgi:hypothetical protein